jgi:nitrogen fixation NifU-like protein
MDNIYREELMEIYRNPAHKGHLDQPSASSTKKNPMCGDVLTMELNVLNDKIVDAKFDGLACSVSVISASLLSDQIIGKAVSEAKAITKEDFLKSINLNLTTSRVQCAVLALTTLADAIKNYETKQS